MRSVHAMLIYIILIVVFQGINAKKPFHHPAIIKTLQDCFFGHSQKHKSSVGQKHQEMFTSSIHMSLTAACEVELPPAMVAMAAVAVSHMNWVYSVLTTHRFTHPSTRRSWASISMQMSMKICTTPLSYSWRRFGKVVSQHTTD